MFMFLGELTRDKRKYEKLGCIGYTIKPETFDIIANDISLLVHKDLLPGCEPFYDPIILFKDRYKVLKEEIKRIGVNHREEVYSYFVSICPGLFDELNQGRDEDIFNECVKKIFDSDTYYELYRNLEALSKADEFYQNGRKEAAFDRIKDILSGNYKTAVLGHVLSFTNENNNKIEKPSSISERTKTLYLKHDLVPQDFNWDVLEISNFPLQNIKNRLDAEAYEYNAGKQISLLENQNQSITDQSKQKKKSIFNIFG